MDRRGGAGFDSHVVKPVRFEILHALVVDATVPASSTRS
jgi:hypothetical protein